MLRSVTTRHDRRAAALRTPLRATTTRAAGVLRDLSLRVRRRIASRAHSLLRSPCLSFSLLLKAPLYLGSTLKNERQGSRISNRQLVYMTPQKDSKATWSVQKIAPSDPGVSRLLSQVA